MIIINSLALTFTATSIMVDVETDIGKTITKVSVWSSNTYKDTTKAVDVSSLLAGTSNKETFDIPVAELGVSTFNGIYWVEFTSSDDETAEGIVANFIPYHECMMDKSLSISVKNCKIASSKCEKEKNSLNTISAMLDTLYTATQFGLFSEAIQISETLDEECEVCTTCPDLGDAMLMEGYGFKTVSNIITRI